MRDRLLCLGALASVVLSGCAADRPVADEPPAIATTSTPSQPEESGTRVRIYSHCGVRSAWVAGELWLARPPLGGHNPPAGWDENQTAGWFVVTAPERGIFHGDGGQRAAFRLAEAGTTDPNTGCE